MELSGLDIQANLISEMFISVSQAVGVHVMLLVLEHARWQSKQEYEEADRIAISEEGVSLNGLRGLEPGLAGEITTKFIVSVTNTLGRLVGKQLAKQLAEQLNIHPEEE